MNKRWVVHVICALLSLCVCSCITNSALAESSSPWFDGPPNISDPSTYDPTAVSGGNIYGNYDCQEQDIAVLPIRTLHYAETRRECTIDTAYGSMASNSYLLRQGTKVWGTLKRANSKVSARIAPIPRSSNGFMILGQSASGTYVGLVRDLDSQITTKVESMGMVTHYLASDAAYQPLQDTSGARLDIDFWSSSYSADGEWLVADMPNKSFLRINTKTLEVLPFGTKTNHNKGLNPGFMTAISPDGRYAVLSSNTLGTLKLYDLWTCGDVPAKITNPVSCTNIDLMQLLRQKIPNLTGTYRPQFIGGHTVVISYIYKDGTSSRYGQTTLQARGTQPATFEYLALGDSFASGEGAYAYKALTDTEDNKCHLSLQSYPYLMSSVLNFGRYESVACSGSIINDIVASQEEYEPRHLAPPDSNVFEEFIPGVETQRGFIERYQPDAITVSISGNDVGFADIIKRCVSVDTCYGYFEERLSLLISIDEQYDNLHKLYVKLLSSKSPAPRIYAIGYPKLADPTGNCAANVHLNRAELEFANDLTDYLNSMIKQAADRAGVFYVDVTDALNGHKFCEINSSDIAVNGVTAGNDAKALKYYSLPIGNESFHPNALGHRMLSKTILERTNNLTAAMPTAQPTLKRTLPTMNLPALNVPYKYSLSRRLIQNLDNISPVVNAGGEWTSEVGADIKLDANTSAEVWMYSTPRLLQNNIKPDQTGRLNIRVTIPADTEPGFHTIHIFTKTVTDELVDIQRLIYVAASPDDIDGDGLQNDVDPCPALQQANLDADKDGVDDACDGLIGNPPTPDQSNDVPSPEPTEELPTPILNPPNSDQPEEPPVEPEKDPPLPQDPLPIDQPAEPEPEQPPAEPQTPAPPETQTDPDTEQQNSDTTVDLSPSSKPSDPIDTSTTPIENTEHLAQIAPVPNVPQPDQYPTATLTANSAPSTPSARLATTQTANTQEPIGPSAQAATQTTPQSTTSTLSAVDNNPTPLENTNQTQSQTQPITYLVIGVIAFGLFGAVILSRRLR